MGKEPSPRLPRVHSAIGTHVTRSTARIGPEATLEQAAMMMRDWGARYLPVCERGHPVGMLAERDVALASSFSERPLRAISVAEAMSGVPYCVAPETPVAVVARHLALRQLDVALVRSGSTVLGVFTLVDALHLLASFFGADTTGADT